ncbi:MAG: hypothetical protein JW800_06585 [Candidatus Omnitrophica bacterium]|nr:hypothetical protein [Candidatus Omnitrophota bacterium]
MISINLLPKEMRKKQIEMRQIPLLPIAAVFLGLIVFLHLSFILAVNVKTRSLKRLETSWQKIQPERQEAERYKDELVSMRSKIDAIDSLIEGRMSWAKKLSDLSDAIIPGVWLNKLWLEKKVSVVSAGPTVTSDAPRPPVTITEKTLHLSGSVIATGGEETAAIGKFIRSLEKNQGFFKDFKEIKSASIQRANLKDVEVMNFELIGYFK